MYIQIYRLQQVFIAACGLSLVAASGGYSSLWCIGFSLQWLFLQSTDSRCMGFSSCSTWAQQLQLLGPRVHGLLQLWHTGSVVVVHRLSCSEACGLLPDQGLNPCSLHWHVDSYPLYHRGSPLFMYFKSSHTMESNLDISFNFHQSIPTLCLCHADLLWSFEVHSDTQ